VPGSRYYAWVVLDVEDWSSRPAVNGARIQRALNQLVTQSLASAGIDPGRVARQPRGDGAVLALPGDIAKEVITTEFVEALRGAVSEYAANCDPADLIRLRLALHAGEGIAGEGEWAGRPVITACRLVDSAVLKRVLAASTGYSLAVIVSTGWYDAVVREGYAPADGYREVWTEVKSFTDFAWIKVPGRSSPPGLLPEDHAARHRAAGESAARPSPSAPAPGEGDDSGGRGGVTIYGNAVNASTINSDVVFGDKINYGSDRQNRSGER
jgi:hypothetical protein